MNITQQDAEEIVNNCSAEMLQDFKAYYHIDKKYLIDRLLKLNNTMYASPPQKDNIDFVITFELDNGYRQFYFLIMEKGKMSPHLIEKLERIKIK